MAASAPRERTDLYFLGTEDSSGLHVVALHAPSPSVPNLSHYVSTFLFPPDHRPDHQVDSKPRPASSLPRVHTRDPLLDPSHLRHTSAPRANRSHPIRLQKQHSAAPKSRFGDLLAPAEKAAKVGRSSTKPHRRRCHTRPRAGDTLCGGCCSSGGAVLM